jgi:ketosteroid isomerase-like protein
MSSVSFAGPEEAEAAFYAAFERGDINAMMTVWADDDQAIVCVHPRGPVLAGRQAVRQSWQTIFAHSPGLKFRIAPQLQTLDSHLAVHVVHEHIQLSGEEQRQHTVIATNAYRRTATGWRMVLHHASPGTAAGDTQSATLH